MRKSGHFVAFDMAEDLEESPTDDAAYEFDSQQAWEDRCSNKTYLNIVRRENEEREKKENKGRKIVKKKPEKIIRKYWRGGYSR